jgi:hypothetical protein
MRCRLSVQKAIFPGLMVGIIFIIFVTSMLATNTGRVVAEPADAPELDLSQGNLADTMSDDGSCTISGSYPQSIQQWCSLIERYARENGLDPNLVSAVMLQESAGKADAFSKSGAVGLLQVMPRDGKAASFMCINGPCFADRPTSQELFDPEFNISFGTRYLAGLVRRFGNVRDALKSYGPKDVGYYYADIVLNIHNSNR